MRLYHRPKVKLNLKVIRNKSFKVVVQVASFVGISVLQGRQWKWVFVTNSDFIITKSLEPNVTDLRYFKLWILLNQIIGVWNIKGLQHRVLKILGFKYLILLHRLNSFRGKLWIRRNMNFLKNLTRKRMQ